jgi:glucokinase
MQMPANAEARLEMNLAKASEGLKGLLDKNKIPARQLEGIGVSFPGIVDTNENCVVSRYVKYGDAAGFDFNDWAQKRWGLPLGLENDARAALVGEWQYGAGRDYDNIAMITLGTGLGSAVLLNGRLLRGHNFIAGNLWGHISVNLNGTLCNCGNIGCLETEASAWILDKKFKGYAGYEHSRLNDANISFADIFQAAAEGDRIATELMNHCLHAWGTCAVSMVHAYDPEVLVISGGLMHQASIILPHLQMMIDKYSWLRPGTTRVLKSQQQVYAALLGLEYLFVNKRAGEKI